MQGIQHHMAWRTRSGLLWLPAFFMLLVVALATPAALAQDEETTGEVASVEIRFWAFSRNPQFFAYQTTNHLGEQMLCVGQADTPDPVFTQAADENNSIRDILISEELRAMYGWAADGVVGTTSPSGASELRTIIAGPNIAVSVVQSGRSYPIGTIPLITDGSSFATAEVKEVRWSPDEAVVVVIMHQVLRGEWPMEVDVAYGFSVPGAPAPPAPASEPAAPPSEAPAED